MRRSDREITDFKVIKAFLDKEKIMRIAFYDNGDIYIVPVNYGYSYINKQYTFYFHGAKAGRKYELACANPLVGFEIDGNYELLEGDTACDYSARFQSIIGTGELSLLESLDEKRAGLDILMSQAAGKTSWDYSDKAIDSVAVFRLSVDKLSCKAK